MGHDSPITGFQPGGERSLQRPAIPRLPTAELGPTNGHRHFQAWP
ncbi:MAG TPA: hypothetical protein V6C88_19655 [Chroococcidiopsis sp.]